MSVHAQNRRLTEWDHKMERLARCWWITVPAIVVLIILAVVVMWRGVNIPMADQDQEGEISLVDQNGTTPVDPEEIKGRYEEYKVP